MAGWRPGKNPWEPPRVVIPASTADGMTVMDWSWMAKTCRSCAVPYTALGLCPTALAQQRTRPRSPRVPILIATLRKATDREHACVMDPLAVTHLAVQFDHPAHALGDDLPK